MAANGERRGVVGSAPAMGPVLGPALSQRPPETWPAIDRHRLGHDSRPFCFCAATCISAVLPACRACSFGDSQWATRLLHDYNTPTTPLPPRRVQGAFACCLSGSQASPTCCLSRPHALACPNLSLRPSVVLARSTTSPAVPFAGPRLPIQAPTLPTLSRRCTRKRFCGERCVR